MWLQPPKIPTWLIAEVEEYFRVPLNMNPATILDIGANIGAFALRAHHEWPGAQVVCYEPMPANIDLLSENTESDWCVVEPSAVRAVAGIQNIYLGDMFVTGGFVKGQRQTNQVIPVNCVAANSLASAELVKIDTEGCELEIIESLDLSKTRVLMLEHHSSADAYAIHDFLRSRFELIAGELDSPIGSEIYFSRSNRC